MRGWWTPTIAAVAIAVSLLAVGLTAPRTTLERPAVGGVSPAPSVVTSPHGNLVVHNPGPQGTVPPGSVLSAEYRIAVVNYTPALGFVTLRVPGVEAVFQTVSETVFVAIVPRNLTIMGAGYYASNLTTGSLLLVNGTSFLSGELATFSTELASIMGPLPYGQMSVIAQWQWRLATPDGAVTNGSWSPSPGQTVPIAQTVQLVSVGPLILARGSSLTACLEGPVYGRTFSLHAETINPLNDFVQSTSPVPSGAALPVCWTITMPIYIAPQPLLIHIWDYNQVTLLLYIVKATLVASLPGSALNGTGPPIPFLVILDAGALGVGVLIAIWAWVDRAGRRTPPRPPGPASAPPPAPPPGATG